MSLNQTGIKKTEGVTRKNILVAPELAFSLPVKVNATAAIKAGTPLIGNLKARDTAFTAATSATAANATCITLHDIEAGDINATALIFGFVDETKLDASVQTIVDAATKLNITFVK